MYNTYAESLKKQHKKPRATCSRFLQTIAMPQVETYVNGCMRPSTKW